MVRIDAALPHNLASDGRLSDQGLARQSTAGSFRGETVQTLDTRSVLTDAAEEITFAHSEKVEDKELAERKLAPGERLQVLRLEEIRAYLDAAHDEGGEEKLVALAKRMLAGQQDPLQSARQASAEPARQFIALQYALRHGEEEGAEPAVLAAIEDALEELMLERGPQVRAGLNSVHAAATVAGGSAAVETFQSDYRDLVLGQATLADTLGVLLERYPQEDFPCGLAAMIRALGDDLAAARPSTDPNRLHALVSDLYQLEVAATLLERCAGLAATVHRDHGVEPFVPTLLLRELTALSNERWVNGSRFAAIAERCGCAATAPQIRFLTEVKGVMRELPVKIFADVENRQSLLNAVQDALDAAIDREEEGR